MRNHVLIQLNQQENTSHIIDVLQKLKNETDGLVKTANIFSLAKKPHSHPDESQTTHFDVDPAVNNFSNFPQNSDNNLSFLKGQPNRWKVCNDCKNVDCNCEEFKQRNDDLPIDASNRH